MTRDIEHNGQLIARIVDHRGIENGTHPVTDPSWSLQLLVMQREAGHVFVKHTHAAIERRTEELQEAVLVTKGVLRVSVCTRSGEDIGAFDIASGQCIYLVDGGYHIEVVEDAQFFEFKNGPHLDDKVLL